MQNHPRAINVPIVKTNPSVAGNGRSSGPGFALIETRPA